MECYVILDATHYPVEIHTDINKAHKALANRNRGLVDNLCYLVRSRITFSDDKPGKE